MPVALTIRPGRKDETDTLAIILGQAFHPLPSARWLIGDPATRSRALLGYFAMLVDHALTAGHADVAASRRTDRPIGLALWCLGDDPGTPDDYDTRLAKAVPAEYLDRFVLLDALVHDAHPGHGGFEYLAYLAVRPTIQRHGIGTSLLNHRHRHLDTTGTPAFLIAATERSRELYARHHYHLTGGPVALPGGPSLWPMWRQLPGGSL